MADTRQYRDDSLAFDDRRGPPPRRGPAPVTLIISVLLLLGVAGGVAYLYRDGVRGSGGPPRPVGAPLRDVRTIAPPSPQAADPAAGLSIYKDDPNAAAAPKFAAPPEEPAPRVVAAQPAVATPSQAADASVAAKAAPSKAPTIDSLIDQANDRPAKVAKAAKPDQTAKADAKVKGDLKSSIDTREAVAAPVKAVVQIGAFSSEELATKAFHDAARLGGGRMGGKSMRIVPIVKGDQTLYRVAAVGFASKDDAQGVCDTLKAAGKSCFVR